MLNRLNRNVYEEFLRQFICFSREKKWNSDSIYLFKGNRGNTRTMGEIYSKLTIKTLEHGVKSKDFTYFSSVSIVYVEQLKSGWQK